MNGVRRPASAGLIGVAAVSLAAGCAGPRGATAQEKRDAALEMRDRALAAVLADKPELAGRIEHSAGYAVFSNFAFHPGLLSFARGYGVLTNRLTGKETFMRWTRLTFGPGIAIKGVYTLSVVDDAETLAELEKGRWLAIGQVEAGLVFGEFGQSFEKGWIYQSRYESNYTTHHGVALELELIGFGRVSNDRELNRAHEPTDEPRAESGPQS